MGKKKCSFSHGRYGSNSEGHVSKESAEIQHNADVVQAGWKQSTLSCVYLVSAGDDTDMKTVTAAMEHSIASNVSTGVAGKRNDVDMVQAGWKQITSDHVELAAAGG